MAIRVRRLEFLAGAESDIVFRPECKTSERGKEYDDARVDDITTVAPAIA